ncbi:MAG TPA: glutathione S-transferase family protein [Solirubrobacteraceae bacterium]|nr:glutathione S-transferase family protein [Solirubrobacteraceae bacterium]
MAVVLWHIELSHYNEKARWALDCKGIPHERRVPIPGFGHGVRAAVLTRGAQRRLPVLELDGRRVGDSTAIIAALEEYRPEPALYPDDPAERALALALEDRFDEELGPAVRRLVWFHTLPDADATAAALFTTPNPRRERLLRATIPVARRVVSADYGINATSAASARETIVAAMDDIEARLGPSGYLVGGRFSVADLAGAALFTPLLAPPERPYAPARIAPSLLPLREELKARPGGRWVAEMYARHRGTWQRPEVTGSAAV